MTTRTLMAAAAVAVLAASVGGAQAADATAAAPNASRASVLAADPRGARSADIVVMLVRGADAGAVARDYGAVIVDRFGQRPIWRLRLAATSAPHVVKRLQRDPRVAFAESNVATQSPEGRQIVVWAYVSDPGTYTNQWVPQALALPQAHALATGAGVRVAVLDSGADIGHPVLAPRFARTATGAVLGRDFVDDDDDASEVGGPGDPGWGHGTHVAGLVALAAPEAQLMPVRVLDRNARGNVWVLAEALMWALDPDGNPATDDGARVINISLGTIVPTRLLDVAVELATCSDDDDNETEVDYGDPGFDDDRARCDRNGGAVVMAAAGNDGSATQSHFPAAEGAEGQLAITASTAGSLLAPFANRGPWVQLAAPGKDVVSTMAGGGWASWSGTSMSTPLASGVAALVLQRHPDWKPVDVTKRLQDRSQRLCVTGIRGLHAFGAVADEVPADAACR
jgi:subtilisin family serine protease